MGQLPGGKAGARDGLACAGMEFPPQPYSSNSFLILIPPSPSLVFPSMPGTGKLRATCPGPLALPSLSPPAETLSGELTPTFT